MPPHKFHCHTILDYYCIIYCPSVKPVAVITCGATTIDGRVINPMETMKQVVDECNFIKTVFVTHTSELPASEKYADLEKVNCTTLTLLSTQGRQSCCIIHLLN